MISASCHCGAVRIEISRKPRTLTACNCSICRRYGAIWAYFTRKSVNLRFARGAVTPYVWGNGGIEFFHCKRCGCITHYERTRKMNGDTRVAVNVRNVDPEEIASIPIRKLDGASTWKVVDDWPFGWA